MAGNKASESCYLVVNKIQHFKFGAMQLRQLFESVAIEVQCH